MALRLVGQTCTTALSLEEEKEQQEEDVYSIHDEPLTHRNTCERHHGSLPFCDVSLSSSALEVFRLAAACPDLSLAQWMQSQADSSVCNVNTVVLK